MSDEKPTLAQIAYYYAGVRTDNGKTFSVVLEIVNRAEVTDDVSATLSFEVPLSRVKGAQIGASYWMKFKGGTSWMLPVGGEWVRALARVRVVAAERAAQWEVQDMAARGLGKDMKFKNTANIERALMPLASIYWKLSERERPAFEVFILRHLRNQVR